MLGPVANVHHPALFKMAVADVEIAVVAIDGDATTPELTAIEREVVIVELQESNAPFAILEQAVLEGGFRERLAFVGMVLQDRGIGEAPKRQMPVRDLSLKSLSSLIMKSHAGPASTIEVQADKS